MSNYRDMEHDTIADAPAIVGKPAPLGEEPTERHLDREERREVLAEQRAAQKTEMPASREAMLAKRYRILTYPEGTEAANDEWLSLDNDDLFSPVRTPR